MAGSETPHNPYFVDTNAIMPEVITCVTACSGFPFTHQRTRDRGGQRTWRVRDLVLGCGEG